MHFAQVSKVFDIALRNVLRNGHDQDQTEEMQDMWGAVQASSPLEGALLKQMPTESLQREEGEGGRVQHEYMTPRARSRMWAMRAVAKAIRDGVLTRQPCEMCGISGDEVMCKGQRRSIVQAHHDDYNYPLAVRWLCISHHHQWHKYHSAKEMADSLVGVPPLALYRLGLEQMKRREQADTTQTQGGSTCETR